MEPQYQEQFCISVSPVAFSRVALLMSPWPWHSVGLCALNLADLLCHSETAGRPWQQAWGQQAALQQPLDGPMAAGNVWRHGQD